jgi:hypothetical protein
VRHYVCAFIIVPAALLASATTVRAADQSNADVLTRARPEYDALGIRLGTFFFYPAISAGVGYNDNVFNDASSVGDYFYALAPEFKLESGWSRHALNIAGGAKYFSFADQAGENRTDWNLGADLRLDVLRGTEIKADAHFARLHEPRGTDLTGGIVPGDPAEPTELSRSGFGAEVGHTLNRVRLSLGLSLDQIDYEDTPRVLPAAPAVFNNDDRDRTITEFFTKAAVEVSEDTAVFVRGRWSGHDFDVERDDEGFKRDSSGWGVDGGVEFAMTHLLVGELFAGYTLRSYDDPAFDEAAEFGFGAGLKWFPSMLTTISVDAARTIEDTSIQAASGYVSTRGQLGIDHEMLRNFIFSGRVGYESAEYQDVARSDDILRGSLGGRFLLNNHFHFDAGWEYTNRSSSDLPFEYSTGQFQLSLTGKL